MSPFNPDTSSPDVPLSLRSGIMSTRACQGLTKVDQEDVTLTSGDTGSKASVLTA